jgi:hypothetical protein
VFPFGNGFGDEQELLLEPLEILEPLELVEPIEFVDAFDSVRGLIIFVYVL